MNINYLKYFISVAKHLNFTKAAQECYISQTAMSQHISKMEEELGFKLFYRNNRVVELTEGGKVFLKEAVALSRKYDYAVSWGSVASMNYKGYLRVGFLSYGERLFLPQLLHIFHQRNPKVEIALTCGNLSQLSNKLRDDKLDVILVYPYDIMDIPNIAMKTFPIEELCLVVNKDHPMAKEEKVSSELIKKEPFLFANKESSPRLYQKAFDICNSLGFEPKISGTPTDMNSLLLMLEIGLGVTFLPAFTQTSNSDALVYLKIEDNIFIDAEYAITYISDNQNPSLKMFLKIIDELEKEEKLMI